MGFVRIVTVCCDGPCGTAIGGLKHVPEGWIKLRIETQESLQNGQKPTHKALRSMLCPKCAEIARNALIQAHIVLAEGEVAQAAQ